uniref:Coatomer subunit epsilon n=1 Tax=Fibrocapsa japonica TaxID=94617 RepID=A0A7S2XUN8_9STRA|mmetsp:Transcript_11236/g.16554  ORF Transcript_11236/g.16554 Transcript_11236/m.16554 type:complete len:293 (+) Transcript_11236:83-961(+)|eukprot:CAMPEP_0113936118 /NCGR_PEP_ID=MMETSP1339-20121228/3089_1 /TAXON_ID=94617 /ORGANISM="Fibrocapsa japonica" /LENGTH=292 /DNA_ID=CAMNT_0000938463 /DNA_START=67 /DNA_END=945 /DNA_ORIENTATION=- /assembly_acc=CAM_ASM_000762
MAEPDDLYTLRNHFWLGNYQMAISEGSSLGRLRSELALEKDEFVYRSYVALGQYQVVLSEVNDNSAPSLQAVRLLAQYLSDPSSRELVLETLPQWLTDNHSPTLQLISAQIYMHENDLKNALKAVGQGVTMEHLALLVSLYLRLGRIDLAQQQLRLMQQADEDATLTQMAQAWVLLHQGSSKLEECGYLVEELCDKFNASTALLNALACAKMHAGQAQEAEQHLVQAASKNQNDPDTLVNMICCYQHLQKPEDFINRYVNQLKSVAPEHPYVKAMTTVEGAFDRVASTYALS